MFAFKCKIVQNLEQVLRCPNNKGTYGRSKVVITRVLGQTGLSKQFRSGSDSADQGLHNLSFIQHFLNTPTGGQMNFLKSRNSMVRN